MKTVTGFFMAWGNFCAIPCPCKRWDEDARRYMLAAIPAVGLVIGILWWGLFWAVRLLAVPIPVSAALMSAYPFVVSGFIHLDGFMDCSDAILSRRPLPQRQQILKDSHVGAFAVISAILLFMVFFSSMWSILEAGKSWIGWCLMAAPVLARCLPARDVLSKRPLSTSQYDKSFDPGANRRFKRLLEFVWLLAALALSAGAAAERLFSAKAAESGFLEGALIMAAAQLVACLLSGSYGRKQLGGMSGDIAGFTIVWGELAAVLSLAIIQEWI